MTNQSLANKIAVVTGAGSGIGKAIALKLASHGSKVILLGRSLRKLKAVKGIIDRKNMESFTYPCDITDQKQIFKFKGYLEGKFGRLDILIHSAGVIFLDDLGTAKIEDFDQQYQVNVRAPFVLTQALLPLLKPSYGQIVFINSTAGLKAGVNNGLYSATKHALKAIADSFRLILNPYKIRVISVYPGRTATPMQKAVYKAEGKLYQAEKLSQPEDVALIVYSALTLPISSEITDIVVRPLVI